MATTTDELLQFKMYYLLQINKTKLIKILCQGHLATKIFSKNYLIENDFFSIRNNILMNEISKTVQKLFSF